MFKTSLLPYVSALPDTLFEWCFNVLYLLCCKLFQTLSSCTKAFKIQMVVKSPVENRLLFQTSVLFFSVLVHSRFWQIRRNIHSLMQLDSTLAWAETSGPKSSAFYQRAKMHAHASVVLIYFPVNSDVNCFVLPRQQCWFSEWDCFL